MTEHEPTETELADVEDDSERRAQQGARVIARKPERIDALKEELGALAEEDSERVTRTTTGHSENTPVNHPVHYNLDPSGIECIEIVRHRNFNVGNAMKYLWRAGLKVHDTTEAKSAEIQDLEKAVWYIKDEIARLKALS